MNKHNFHYLLQLFGSFITIFLLFNLKFSFLEIISLTLFFFFILKFTYDLGKGLSIKNIIAIIATMQWLLGPVLGYFYNDLIYYNYRMCISKELYFSYALPASLAYFFGLFLVLGKSHKMLNFNNYPIEYYKKGKFFIIIGFILGFLPIGFLAYILGGLKYVGLFYMFASKNKFKYYWIIFVFGLLLISSLSAGMFHDLILWGSFFMMMFFIFFKASYLKRFLSMTIGLSLIILIQFVKGDYRTAILTNSTRNINNFELYLDIVKNKIIGNKPFFSDENIASNVSRINQGWIISNVMDHVPYSTPYANGITIKDAIVASIFPRIILNDKAIAGGRLNMEKYAGITLNENTSMDISQIGEAYANFGIIGGILFMFILGLFFNLIINFIEKKAFKYPDLIFWIPLIFLQAVKAETSLVTILNHVTKTTLVVWFFFSSWGNALINSKFQIKKTGKTLIN